MGEFNAGKSTFINAWIGEEVAPMGVTPTTATLNLLSYGAEKKVRLHMADDSAREGRYEDLQGLLAEAEKAGPDRVRLVEILYPAEELLRVQILDTPGLNAPVAGHERTALRAIDEADAVVFLFRAGQAGKDTEREALGKIAARRRKALGVVNHADRVSAEELPGVVARLREELGAALEDVVPLSARVALEAKKAGDAARLEASALPAVRATIEDRFFVPARAIKRRNAATRAEEAIAAATRETEASLVAAAREEGAVRAQVAGLAAERTVAAAALRRASGVVQDGIAQAARSAAAETDGFVAPRRRFWEARGVAAEDLEFLADLYEDRIGAVLESARKGLARDLGSIGQESQALQGELRGAARGALLLARGLLRGGRLEAALLASDPADPDALGVRLRQVPAGVAEEAEAAFGAAIDRVLASSTEALERRLDDLARSIRRRRLEGLRVLEAFADAIAKVE
jgi:GTP-binding protein EngB required for normal cell division